MALTSSVTTVMLYELTARSHFSASRMPLSVARARKAKCQHVDLSTAPTTNDGGPNMIIDSVSKSSIKVRCTYDSEEGMWIHNDIATPSSEHYQCGEHFDAGRLCDEKNSHKQPIWLPKTNLSQRILLLDFLTKALSASRMHVPRNAWP